MEVCVHCGREIRAAWPSDPTLWVHVPGYTVECKLRAEPASAQPVVVGVDTDD